MAKKGYIFKNKDKETLSIIADYLYVDTSNNYITSEDVKKFIIDVNDLSNNVNEFEKKCFDNDKVKTALTTSKLDNQDPSYYATSDNLNLFENDTNNTINNDNDILNTCDKTIKSYDKTISDDDTKLSSFTSELNSINNTLNNIELEYESINPRIDNYNGIIENDALKHHDVNIKDDLKLSAFSNNSILTITENLKSSINSLDYRWNILNNSFKDKISEKNNAKMEFLNKEDSFEQSLNKLKSSVNNLQNIVDSNTDLNIKSLKVEAHSKPYINDIYLKGSDLIIKGNDPNIISSKVNAIKINNNRPREIYLNSTKIMNVYYENDDTFKQYQLYKYHFTVRWLNFDNSILYSEIHTFNHIPKYTGVTPEKPSDNTYNYAFSGWSPSITSLIKDVDYIAQFAVSSYVEYPIYIGLEYRNNNITEKLIDDDVEYNAHYNEYVISSTYYNDDIYETSLYKYSGKNIEIVYAGKSINRICTFYTSRELKYYTYYIYAIYNGNIIDTFSGTASYNTQIPVLDIYGTTYEKDNYLYSSRNGATKVNIKTNNQIINITYATREVTGNYLYLPSPSKTFTDYSSINEAYTEYEGTLNSNIVNRLYSNFDSSKDKIGVNLNGTWYDMNNLPSNWSVEKTTFVYDNVTYYGIKLHYVDWEYDEEDYSYGSDMLFNIGTNKSSGTPTKMCFKVIIDAANYPNGTSFDNFQLKILN